MNFKNLIFVFLILLLYVIVRTIIILKKKVNFEFKTELINFAFIFYISLLFDLLIINNLNLILVSSTTSRFLTMKIISTSVSGMYNVVPFKTITEELASATKLDYANLIINFLIMMPMPIFITLVNNKMNKYVVILITFLIVVSIEMIQYFIGRVFDIDDVILNTAGAIVAYLIFLFSKKAVAKKINICN
jgi:glycopeptide antibiotics resistance protein